MLHPAFVDFMCAYFGEALRLPLRENLSLDHASLLPRPKVADLHYRGLAGELLEALRVDNEKMVPHFLGPRPGLGDPPARGRESAAPQLPVPWWKSP
jgi:hypothetical protein